MGTLAARIALTPDDGSWPRYDLSSMYIWREESKEHDDDTLTYNVARLPPEAIEWEEEVSYTFTETITHRHTNTPIIQFRHKYSDGAELCVARAILALHEAEKK